MLSLALSNVHLLLSIVYGHSVGRRRGPMVLKGGMKGRFAFTTMDMWPTWPLIKELGNNTHRGHVTSLSTLDTITPLVLYIAVCFY